MWKNEESWENSSQEQKEEAINSLPGAQYVQWGSQATRSRDPKEAQARCDWRYNAKYAGLLAHQQLQVSKEIIDYLHRVYCFLISPTAQSDQGWKLLLTDCPLPSIEQDNPAANQTNFLDALDSSPAPPSRVEAQLEQLTLLMGQLIQLQLKQSSPSKQESSADASKTVMAHASRVLQPFQASPYPGTRCKQTIEQLEEALNFNMDNIYVGSQWTEQSRISVVKSCLTPEVQANIMAQFRAGAGGTAMQWIAQLQKLYRPSPEEECQAARTGVKAIRLGQFPSFAAMCNQLDKHMPSTGWDEISKLEQLERIMGSTQFSSLRKMAFANLQRAPTYAEMKDQAIRINLEGSPANTSSVSSVQSKTFTVVKKVGFEDKDGKAAAVAAVDTAPQNLRYSFTAPLPDTNSHTTVATPMSTSSVRVSSDNKRIHAVHFITSLRAVERQAPLASTPTLPQPAITFLRSVECQAPLASTPTPPQPAATRPQRLHERQFPAAFRQAVHAKEKKKGRSWKETEDNLQQILSHTIEFKGEYHPTSLRCWLREQATPEPDHSSAQVSTLIIKPSTTLSPTYQGLGCKEMPPVSHSSYAGDGFYFKGRIDGNGTVFLLDSGAQINVIGEALADRLSLTRKRLPTPIKAYYGNNSHFPCVEFAEATINLSTYQRKVQFVVANIPDTHIILGVPWLKAVTIQVDWCQEVIKFICNARQSSHTLKGASAASAEDARTKLEAKVSVVSFNTFTARGAGKQRSRHWKVARISEIFGPIASATPVNKESMSAAEKKLKDELIASFPKLFAEPTGLPPSRPEDMDIKVDPTKPTPKQRSVGKMSGKELEALKMKLTELLERGFIRPSTSEYGAAVLFVPKPDGSLRMCLDYRGLNSVTVLNRSPIPSVTEMRTRLASAKFFSKLDLRDGYYNVLVKEADRHKTAFKTRYGLFEFCVVPFGLMNAPGVFCNMMARVLYPFLDVFVICYMDDIIIYSETQAEHRAHIDQVLKLLETNQFHLKPSKCSFFQSSVAFCGHMIGEKGLEIEASKRVAMQARPRIQSRTDIARYLGMTVWFQDYIQDYADITEPLTRLLSPKVPFAWGSEQERAISVLINALTNAPVLKFFDSARETVVYTDASSFAIGGWIGQRYNDGIHPVLFWSRKMTPAERAYGIYEKELLALTSLLERNAYLLRGTHFEAFVDHRALVEINRQTEIQPSRKVAISGRCTRWILFLQEFSFSIRHLDGTRNSVADYLTRNPTLETLCTSCNAAIPAAMVTAITTTTGTDSTFLGEVKAAYASDPLIKQLVAWSGENSKVEGGDLRHQESQKLVQKFAKRNGLWYYLDSRVKNGSEEVFATLYIPEVRTLRTELLRRYHETPTAGHFGAEKSWKAIRRGYFWPGLRIDMQRYCHSCEDCQRQAEPNHNKYGHLHPLPIPADRGTDISIDFFDMPRDAEGFDQVFLIIDRLTKMTALVPSKSVDTTADTARRFINSWFAAGKGLPTHISSDRDSLFTSKLWQEITAQLHIQQTMTTARHQSANGQAEVYVRTVKKVLKKTLNYRKDNWKAQLPLVEFAVNNAEHAATGYSPFFLFYGFEPRVFPDEVMSKPKETNQLLVDIGKALEVAKQNLIEAQVPMSKFANSKRSEAPSFPTGSSVWLLNENFHWCDAAKESKLPDKKIGPFCVKRGNEPGNPDPTLALCVELELPSAMLAKQIHPVFHVSKLEPFIESDPEEFPNRLQYQGKSVGTNAQGEQLYDIQEVLDHRMFRGNLQYLLHLKGCARREAEWYTYTKNDPEWDKDRHWIQEYQQKYGLPSTSRTRRSPRPNNTQR